jgi:murein DD-endopeptidase MepM/ murein hydrolase activator NlpD
LRRLFVLTLLVLSACVTQRPREKMSFEEAFAGPEPAPSPREGAPVARERRRPAVHKPDGDLLVSQTAPELEAALLAFVARSQSHRQRLEQGSVMPQEQVENWWEMGRVVDTFLRRSAQNVSALDIVRARVTLEGELEEDARAYGDMPAALAESVTAQVSRLARRMNELKRLQARATPAPPQQFGWPVRPVVINSTFGRRVHPITGANSAHKGLDLRAERGQAIYTAAPGVVMRAGWSSGYGKLVEVQHAGNVVTRYGHLSEVLVAPGEVLGKGDVVGLAGDTGMATGVHLHFELLREGQPCDPLDELDDPDEPQLVETSRR